MTMALPAWSVIASAAMLSMAIMMMTTAGAAAAVAEAHIQVASMKTTIFRI
jgi:hypothetical protein